MQCGNKNIEYQMQLKMKFVFSLRFIFFFFFSIFFFFGSFILCWLNHDDIAQSTGVCEKFQNTWRLMLTTRTSFLIYLLPFMVFFIILEIRCRAKLKLFVKIFFLCVLVLVCIFFVFVFSCLLFAFVSKRQRFLFFSCFCCFLFSYFSFFSSNLNQPKTK